MESHINLNTRYSLVHHNSEGSDPLYSFQFAFKPASIDVIEHAQFIVGGGEAVLTYKCEFDKDTSKMTTLRGIPSSANNQEHILVLNGECFEIKSAIKQYFL